MTTAMYVLKGSKEDLTVLIVTHVTQVKRVKSGVYSFYATLHTEYCNVTQFVTHVKKGQKLSNTLYTGPLAPPRGKAIYLKAFHLVGLAVHPPVSLRRQLC